jgi:polysaccharide export outer membrane protein
MLSGAMGFAKGITGRTTNKVLKGFRPLKNYPMNRSGQRTQITGVDSATSIASGEPDWGMRGPINFESYYQGEYVGPERLRHVDKYRLRVDDQLQFVYRVTRERLSRAYELNIGDSIRVESVADKDLDRELIIQPDGTITLRLLGQVMAAGRTVDELRRDLEKRYTEYYQEPAVTVTPKTVNTRLEDVRSTVDARAGNGGQQFASSIIPDGTVQLPAVGSVPAHGLTLEELEMEVNARYASIVSGLEVTAVLAQRAPRNIYVVGEVTQPGRVELVGPTTVMQAIALAQGWNNGANLRNVIVFRRAEDWRLLATKIDIQGALYGRRPAPADEIWLRDSDIVLVPKSPIRVIDDAIELLFTNGLYAAAPFFSDPVVFSDQTTL